MGRAPRAALKGRLRTRGFICGIHLRIKSPNAHSGPPPALEQAALLTLSDFSLAKTQCFSAQDREALLALIGEWYTDAQAGETDPERLVQLGHHNFEMIVRHEIAPLLQRAGDGTNLLTWMLRCWLVTFVPFAYDFFATPALPFAHSVELAQNRLCFGVVMLPLASIGSTLSVHLGTRAEQRFRSAAAGLVISTLGILFCIGFGGFLTARLVEPGAIFHPNRACATEDGLDDGTRAIWKWKVVVALNAAGGLVALSRAL